MGCEVKYKLMHKSPRVSPGSVELLSPLDGDLNPWGLNLDTTQIVLSSSRMSFYLWQMYSAFNLSPRLWREPDALKSTKGTKEYDAYVLLFFVCFFVIKFLILFYFEEKY